MKKKITITVEVVAWIRSYIYRLSLVVEAEVLKEETSLKNYFVCNRCGSIKRRGVSVETRFRLSARLNRYRRAYFMVYLHCQSFLKAVVPDVYGNSAVFGSVNHRFSLKIFFKCETNYLPPIRSGSCIFNRFSIS